MEKRINDKLVKAYRDILTIEEQALKTGPFSDLSIKEIHTINAISLHQHKTSSEVSRELSVRPGTLTATIHNLVRKGYVQRAQGSTDRRIVRLGLTRKGRCVYRLHAEFHNKMVTSFLNGFSTSEVSLIERAVDNLIEFLERDRRLVAN
ncbi:MarR family transcriptional regulator [Lactobacillus sp. CC-MHH1034]|nr:MarR family transcriptional regulator [Agrilactobacillus fermenti]